MEIKQYAPVYIPTLNRYEHFRQCLESLEACTGADKTDVIVGLDYPPSEKYVEGWKKIDEYLKEKEVKNGFAKLEVHRRDHNYGIGGPTSNSGVLRQYVTEKYDRFIFSEDDNVFAPCFLEFINKGLDLYADDDRVVALCGYSHPMDFSSGNNTSFAQCINYSVWGYATWVEKNRTFRKDLTKSFFKRVLYSPSKMIKVMRTGWGRTLNVILNSHNDNVRQMDANLSLLMLLKDKVMIMPVKSLVKNIGWDELATNTKAQTPLSRKRSLLESSRELDTSERFEFIGNPFANVSENNQKMIQYGRMYGHTSFKMKLIIMAKFIIRYIQFWE